MKSAKLLLASLAGTILVPCIGNTDYTALVDTRIGTDSSFVMSYGNTYQADEARIRPLPSLGSQRTLSKVTSLENWLTAPMACI